MEKTPKGMRLTIGFFGKRNVGKSSLLNALIHEDNLLYFEKETGLLRKLNDQEYYYSFNTVNDTIFELPEELETQDPLSDVYVVNFTR